MLSGFPPQTIPLKPRWVNKEYFMKSRSYLAKPQAGEYAPFAGNYISLIAEGDIVAILDQQRRNLVLLLSGRDEAEGDFRYAPGKWTVKEVLGHINDTERIFVYRALRIARGDKTPLAGFEQDDYVRDSGHNQCALSDLIEDFIAVRRASVSLFRNLQEDAWMRRGIANNHEFSVRALAYMVAGHEFHHSKILTEKYFSAPAIAAK
jgi:hypothetical protein